MRFIRWFFMGVVVVLGFDDVVDLADEVEGRGTG
jgi:hypothetical protein